MSRAEMFLHEIVFQQTVNETSFALGKKIFDYTYANKYVKLGKIDMLHWLPLSRTKW